MSPEPALLTRGSVDDQSVAGGGGVYDTVVECGGDDTLVVEADMAAGAAGDLAVTVRPVAEDGEVYPVAVPVESSVGPTLSGGRSYFYGRWNVKSQQRVVIRITNANVGAQLLDLNWRLR